MKKTVFIDLTLTDIQQQKWSIGLSGWSAFVGN